MTPVQVAVWLALLLDAGSEPAPAVPTPTLCRVIGRVYTVARDTLPCPFANVLVMSSHIGTMTDETGAYVLSVPAPGRILLMVQAIGSPKVVNALDVVAGQTMRRDFWLQRSRYDIVRDSLKSLGQWPPHPDPALIEHMRAATDVRVFRLGDPRAALAAAADSGQHIGNWPIVGEGRRPSRHVTDGLIEAVRVSAYEIQGFRMASFCESFSPSIDVRFTRDGLPVDVLLNYACYGLSIWREGRWLQSGDFKDERPAEFARHAFPHDPEIQRIRAPGSRPDR